jgi:hypothetical protein
MEKGTIIAIISASAALVSAFMALAAWWYNREISKAVISLDNVKVEGNRVEPGKLVVNIMYILRNGGKETLHIKELSVGHIDFRSKVFTKIGKKPILNPIHGGGVFNYSSTFHINIDSGISNQEIGNILPRVVGKHAIVLRLRYQSDSVFSKSIKTEKYFLGYEGYGAVYQLTEEEYDQIKDVLPVEFKVDA